MIQSAEEADRAIAWFIAGYTAALPDSVEAQSAACTAALTHAERHVEGRCLRCYRQNVVILDGYFCERCAPGIHELVEEHLEVGE